MKILITGSSTGFGKLIAKTLIKEGHEVAASMRNINGKNKEAAAELKEAGAHIVELDVTDEASVNSGVADAVKAMGGLEGVINNAGIAKLGLHEAFTTEDYKDIFEVNVFGVQRVNRAALPHLRAKGSGLLVHISSIAGRVTLPFFGAYTASKWALEALAETYRAELSGYGIGSYVIEPGGFPTEIFNKMAQPSDTARTKSLGSFAKAPLEFANGFAQSMDAHPEQKPQDVADAVAKLIATPARERPFRLVVDKMGMHEALTPYNEGHEKLTKGLYEGFGLADMLDLKVPVA
jgi:NAD(P)-dependent dehydrogenase (short-subunit alcohol dehydrogenase family)